jgi:hypothetical protein
MASVSDMKPAVLMLIALLATSCSSVKKMHTRGPVFSEASVCIYCGMPMWSNAPQCPACGTKYDVPPPPPPLPPPPATTRRAYSIVDTNDQRGSIAPVSPQELQTCRERLSRVRSDTPLKRVLATLGLSRFRGHARIGEGPSDIGVSLDLASDHVLDAYYVRRSSGWELSWVILDEACWYVADGRLSEAAYSSVDGRELGHPLSPPVTAEELERAKVGLKLLRTDLNLRQVLATMGLSRCRGHFEIGSGSISFSVHGDLGNGHKLDMIYDRPTYSPGWKLSWVGIDWQENQTGFGHWEAADSIIK